MTGDANNGIVEGNDGLGDAHSSNAEIGTVPEEVLNAMFGHVNVPDSPTTTADPPNWQVKAAPPWPDEVVEAMTHELVIPGAYMATQDGWMVGTRLLLASRYHDVALDRSKVNGSIPRDQTLQ